ncbi:hypothetical protein M430DRAFT_220142 [Amorphotheca resinae ATCC 22711]|jgi:hypothetical protein|uniref:Uncharacterized protein n=1 Tax=Amorphotheca resinae ATCC 22711 TaxID=857342 RepID=A0A2T3B5L1_AMORE|nr:hypothetical protein M430DRAFT_220142 [Amorphotheca resinae ATCC 22711]PSS22028.1 hypothetical protein M430DRAFT_220142 [Amorphotheca resinae ATCC 22711]
MAFLMVMANGYLFKNFKASPSQKQRLILKNTQNSSPLSPLEKGRSYSTFILESISILFSNFSGFPFALLPFFPLLFGGPGYF